MGPEFSYFLKTIPSDIYSGTQAAICRYIAVFEPKEYVKLQIISAGTISTLVKQLN